MIPSKLFISSKMYRAIGYICRQIRFSYIDGIGVLIYLCLPLHGYVLINGKWIITCPFLHICSSVCVDDKSGDLIKHYIQC